tara:strand:- start:61 stop:300 length:240 start_codon:yes stop_codon:yes gene_type:complete
MMILSPCGSSDISPSVSPEKRPERPSSTTAIPMLSGSTTTSALLSSTHRSTQPASKAQAAWQVALKSLALKSMHPTTAK